MSLMDLSHLLPRNTIAHRICFTDNTHFMIADSYGHVSCFNVGSEIEATTITNQPFRSPIVHFTSKGEYVVAVDVENNMMLWDAKHTCFPLPKLEDAFITSISIQELNNQVLLLVSFRNSNGKNNIKCISLVTQKIITEYDSCFTHICKQRKEMIQGIHVTQERVHEEIIPVIYAWSDKWIIRSTTDSKSNIQLFDNLLHFDFLQPFGAEGVAVERPWSDVISMLPLPVTTKVYGQ